MTRADFLLYAEVFGRLVLERLALERVATVAEHEAEGLALERGRGKERRAALARRNAAEWELKRLAPREAQARRSVAMCARELWQSGIAL